MKGINTQNDLSLVNEYIRNDSSIYDNVFRAIFKSSSLYVGLYIGFEENGFYRYYPYTSFNNYPSFTYRCYYNNLQTTGYDPRCRVWYVIANDSNIHYTSPYTDALTGLVMITSSKRVMNGSSVMGVIGMDFSMQEIDNIITDGSDLTNEYSFMMDQFGLLISYPGLDRNSPVPGSVFTVENDVNPFVWNNIISKKNIVSDSETIIKNSKEYMVVYKYLPDLNYYLVTLFPLSKTTGLTNNIFSHVTGVIKNGKLALSIIITSIIILDFVLIRLFGKKYAKPIKMLSNDLKSVRDANLDIELGNRAPASAEFSAVNQNFGYLLTAVKFGNDAYYGGDMDKAMTSYNEAEQLMRIMNVPRGLSICYNNKANVYKQMGKNTEAEKLYLDSIKIVEDLMSKETDNDKLLACRIMISYRKMNLGVLYKDCGRISEAKKYLEESLDMSISTDNSLGYSKISGNLGQLYLQSGNINEAHELIYGAYDRLKDKTDEISIQYAKMNVGLLELFKHNYSLAEQWFDNVLYENITLDNYVKQTCIENSFIIAEKHNNSQKMNALKLLTSQTLSNRDVLFVLDCSGSMEGQFIRQCKISTQNIITNMLSGKDMISMFTFSNETKCLFENMTKDAQLEAMLRHIASVSTGGGTAFYDALITSINHISKSKLNNKWIAALTDGEDNQSKQNHENVVSVLSKVNVNIVIIVVGSLKTRQAIKSICDCANKKNKGVLIEISRNASEIESVFQKVAQLITGQLHVESL
jgi:tetratricopeptide (TPR) repeat protein